MCHSMKLYQRILENRLRNVVNISERQFVFMKGKCTIDAIFAFRQLQEKYREGQQELYCAFVVLEKSYDRVPREDLVWYIHRKGVPEKFIRLIKDMYLQCVTEVKCVSSSSEPVAVGVGLHQGSALNRFLFAIIMDALKDGIRKDTPSQMMFADDVVLCATDQDSLEDDLEVWREAVEKRGLKVSRTKTEYMCLNGEPSFQKSQILSIWEVPYKKMDAQKQK